MIKYKKILKYINIFFNYEFFIMLKNKYVIVFLIVLIQFFKDYFWIESKNVKVKL